MIKLLLFSAFFWSCPGTAPANLLAQDTLPAMRNAAYEKSIQSIYHTPVPVVSIQELESLRNQPVYLLDTRTKEEFEISHLKHARRVGYYWFDMRLVYNIPKDANIITYCAVGNRSVRIAEKLIKAGYKNVHVLYGGIFEWVNRGNPVYMGQDVQTTLIHGYSEEWAKWVEKGNTVL